MSLPFRVPLDDPRERRRRNFWGTNADERMDVPDPVQGLRDAIAAPLPMVDADMVARQRQAQAIDDLITRNLTLAPVREPSRGQMIVDAVIAGLGNQEPGVGGVGGFLSDVARSAGAVRGVARTLEAQATGRASQAEAERQDRLLEALKARGALDLQAAQAERARREEMPRGQASEPAAVARLRFLRDLPEAELRELARREQMLNPPREPAAPVVTFQQAPTMVGPNGEPTRFNPRTGQYEVVPVAGITPRPKPPTDEQAKSAGFAARVQDAITTLDQFDAREVPGEASRVAAGVPVLNRFVSDRTQVFSNAERQLINAILRRESGAAISPSEFASARAEYIPQAGDGPAVLARKRQNRQRALESLRVSAGPAAPDPYDALRQEYE